MKKELTNRIGHVTKLFKCDLLILSLSEICLRSISNIVDIGFNNRTSENVMNKKVENYFKKWGLDSYLDIFNSK